MDVSIVIVSFNTAGFTLRCLKSISEQIREHEYEVIVIDNASTDGSPLRIAVEFPQVKLIRNDLNIGLAGATTQGLKLSAGRYVVAMNSDVMVLDGAIDKLIRFMDGRLDVGGATPKLLFGDLSPHRPPFGKPPTPWTEIMEIVTEFAGSLTAYSSRYRQEDVALDTSQEVECIVWGTCFVVRREAMEHIGYQDSRFFLYGEDVDWSMRLRKAGWKLWYFPEAQVIHDGGRSANGESPKMFCIRMQSSIKLIQKHYGVLAGLVVREALAFIGMAGYAKWLLLSLWRKARWRDLGPIRRARFGAMLRAAVSLHN